MTRRRLVVLLGALTALGPFTVDMYLSAFPFIATEFQKTAQDIVNGADPQQSLDQAVKDIDANQKSNNYFQ